MKKYAIIFFVLVLCASLGFVGCSPKAETTPAQDHQSAETTEYGQITAMDGSKVTVTVGTYRESQGNSQSSDGEAFDMHNSGNTQYPQGGAPPEIPQEQDGTAPSGDMEPPSGDGAPPQGELPGQSESPPEGTDRNMSKPPSGGSDGSKVMGVPGFTATDETKDYTIDNSVTVTDSQGNVITLEDLQEGDVLAFTLTDSRVTAIRVLSGNKPGNITAPDAVGDSSVADPQG